MIQLPYQELEAAITSELIKHTKGLTVEFTWEGWTEEDALDVGKALYQRMKEPVKVIVNSGDGVCWAGICGFHVDAMFDKQTQR